MNAEIHLNEPFGQAIYNTIVTYKLSNNLEIGSWDGEGSTACFVKAMNTIDTPVKLTCIEINEEKFKTLSDRYREIPYIKCVNQSSIGYNSLVYKDFDKIWSSPFNKTRNQYDKDLVKTWFDYDCKALQETTGFLETDATLYDGVLIDGGEFVGYSEYLLLKDRTKVFFLDDVHHAFKCYQIYRELKDNEDWELLRENESVRNGFAIFINKKYV
jgi:hypothetical protein